MPSVVGKLPTITQPLRKTTSAVVKPTPPGHGPGSAAGSICANRLKFPWGEICTIVVPVPCKLALLLKLLTKMLPRCNRPTDRETRKTPYGFTSPLLGTVDEMVVTICIGPEAICWAEAGLASVTRNSPIATTAQRTEDRIRLLWSFMVCSWLLCRLQLLVPETSPR